MDSDVDGSQEANGMDDNCVTAEDFPHGLRCAECDDQIPEGLSYSERLDGVSTMGGTGDAVFFTTAVCPPCAMRGSLIG